MKTTLDLPDALVRDIQLRAERDGRKLEDVLAGLLVAGLAPLVKPSPEDHQIVPKSLPLIKVRPAQPTDPSKLTTQEWCDWIKDMDVQLEIERYEKSIGYQHVDRVDG